MRRLPLLLLPAALVLLATLFWSANDASDQREVENLRAFAQLFGYVRYFHPSDEAAATDWDRFAVHGVRAVRRAADFEALRLTLERLFLPIAPTLQIFPTEGTAPPPLPGLLRSDTSGLELVAWQHRGFGLTEVQSVYASGRTNRIDAADAPRIGVLMQMTEAAPYRGRTVRLEARGRARVTVGAGQLQFWLRVDRPNQEMGFFDNMDDRPITSPDWHSYQIEGPVSDDAVNIAFGAFLFGDGEADVDDVRLSVRGSDGIWHEVPITNAGFETGESDTAPSGWMGNGTGHRFGSVEGAATEGARMGRIMSKPSPDGISDLLFDAYPPAGTTVTRSLGSGLSVRLPVALYSRDGKTIGRSADPSGRGDLASALRGIDLNAMTAADSDLRFAGVVIAWNVLQHFYPYFDVVPADWNAVLTRTLADASDDDGSRDYLHTLQRMLADLHDGHAGVSHAGDQQDAWLPFLAAWIEDEVVVVAAPFTDVFQIGDLIRTVDGVPAAQLLREAEALYSGTPQWRRQRALNQFGRGPRGDSVRVALNRGGQPLDVTVVRSSNDWLRETRPANVAQLEDGILYVNLTAAETSEIAARIDELAAADGVVFDLRGYPNGNHNVLTHLSDAPLRSAHWQVPRILYPDREDLAGYDTSAWSLPPSQPRIRGEVVFLTDARAISYAESVMGIVEHYRLGEIVGQPTAGANGNIAPFTLPGGFRITFTGMRVLKHDGSQHHLVGIQPTVPVERTIAGVRAGRDEVLEKAVAVIREKSGG